MRVIKILIPLLLISVVALAAGRWVRTIHQSIPTQISERIQVSARPKLENVTQVPRNVYGKYALTDIVLVDEGKAWAVGYDGEHVDRIYYSIDYGGTWQPVELTARGIFHAITFADSLHGWAVGGSGLIIRTTNAGKSWQLLKPPTTAELNAIHFVNSKVGYLAGYKKFGNKISDEVWGTVEILCTNDAGDTWRRCYEENHPGSVFQIVTISESEAFAVLDGNHLIKTDDQGKTWRQVSVSSKYVFSIAFAPNGTGWVVGNKGCFQRSDDGGKTWRQPSSLTQDFVNRDWEAIAFNSNGTGLAVGENDTLALTTDNGQTWKLQDLRTGDHLRAVRLQGSRAIILGSQNAYTVRLSEQ